MSEEAAAVFERVRKVLGWESPRLAAALVQAATMNVVHQGKPKESIAEGTRREAVAKPYAEGLREIEAANQLERDGKQVIAVVATLTEQEAGDLIDPFIAYLVSRGMPVAEP